MLLTKINGEPLEEPIWLDTAIVPRNGSITFRSRFLDFTGKYMLHCHMMNHEELGMMQVVEVYAGDKRPPAAAGIQSRWLRTGCPPGSGLRRDDESGRGMLA